MAHEVTQHFRRHDRWFGRRFTWRGPCGAAAGVLRVAVLACAVWIADAAVASAQGSGGLRVQPLVRDEQVLVSFTLNDGFTDEVRAAIRSGLKTTFTYGIELRLDVPGWVDRTIGTATATSSVEFDNLTRRFTVVRVIDGRTEETRVTEDEAQVRQWLTSLQRLPLFRTSLLEPNREYYVRVAASARPTNGSMLWPFGSGTSAQAKFTFIR
jgi:hypothetical protein